MTDSGWLVWGCVEYDVFVVRWVTHVKPVAVFFLFLLVVGFFGFFSILFVVCVFGNG